MDPQANLHQADRYTPEEQYTGSDQFVYQHQPGVREANTAERNARRRIRECEDEIERNGQIIRRAQDAEDDFNGWYAREFAAQVDEECRVQDALAISQGDLEWSISTRRTRQGVEVENCPPHVRAARRRRHTGRSRA
jgi:hypothetical protein